MKLLQTRLIRDLVVASALTAAALTGVMTLGMCLKLVLSKGIHFVQILPFIPYVAATLLVFTLPLGILVGAILVYGRMSGDLEFAAAQWSGVRPLELYKPALALGAAAALAALALNHAVIPRCQYQIERVKERSLAELPLLQMALGRRSMDFEGPDQERPDGRKVQARYKLFLEGPSRKGMAGSGGIFVFQVDPEVKVATRVFRANSWKLNIGTDPDGKMYPELELKGARWVDLDSKGSLKAQNAFSEGGESFVHRFALPGRAQQVDPKQMSSWALLESLSGAPAGNDRKRREYLVERLQAISGRTALALSCFTFLLMGIPLGLIGKRGNFLAGLGLALIPVFGAFYPLFMLGMAVCGTTWPTAIAAVVAAPAAVGILGVALLHRLGWGI